MLRPDDVPRLLDDPRWERRALGPFVARARARMMAALRSGEVQNDPRPMLRRAYDRVPFYQARFSVVALGRADLSDPRALSTLPPTRRGDLGGGVTPFLSHPVPARMLERAWLGRTSGSTGEPVSYLRDPRTIAWFWAFLDYALAYAGRRPPRRGACVVLLDRLAHLPEYEARLPLFHDGRFAKVCADASPRELSRRLEALAPRVITGDPDSLACLARVRLQAAARPDLVLSSAFPLPSAFACDIERSTGAAVLEYYGAQELGVLGLQCRLDRAVFHAVPGASHVEAHRGEVLATPLCNPSFVLLRYAPGDLAEVEADAPRCRCGLSGGRITELLGRTAISFRDVAGGPYPPARLTPLLSRLPILEHQLVQLDPLRYRLRYRASAPLPHALLGPFREGLRALSGGEVSLSVRRARRPLHAPGAKPAPFEVAS